MGIVKESATYEISFATEHRSSARLLNIKERQKPEATKENSFALFSGRSLWLFCNFLSESRHTNKRLEAG
ncbi:MAG: hypothetical protein DMG54_00375 [Acidobacteria bacterium]|nr:MAG: hypothetical protein DMG53_26410 [Acidobacteriota bacterium]PYU47684.1 MAG: hypothetical protein DMG54_00375 [Acidobacteriota bacterium]PYU74438.1 MAG: hypothetical protein DMG52_11710 [Acidobacteriota bacterium]